MNFIGLPALAKTDDETLETLLKSKIWKPHEELWVHAYHAYLKHQGNPWRLQPCKFDKELTTRQAALYKARSQRSPIDDIRRIQGLSCCPVCGSKTTGSVDHYLPKGAYGEFAIMIANLVPACAMCNSSVKGEIIKGIEPERFIHPYFDEFAQEPLWRVQIIPPYAAATFHAVPIESLQDDVAQIVAFHLKNVLGWHFATEMRNQWGFLPKLIHNENEGGVPKTLDEIKTWLQKKLQDCSVTEGHNGWRTALYRGIVNDPACLDFLREQALSQILV